MNVVIKTPECPAVIIDANPGLDGALALLVALAHTKVLGVTVTYGACAVDTAVRNALDVLALAGRCDVPVARGADRPLFNALPPESPIHAPNGLGGIELSPSQTEAVPQRAAAFIYESVIRSDEPVTLIATGPLTNIAIALATYPDLVERIAGISMAGGSLTYGNVTPAAEFNMWADPEAASVVFRSGVPIRMCGLNVTQYARFSRDALNDLISAQDQSRVGRFVASVVEIKNERINNTYGANDTYGVDEASFPAPCGVFALTCPHLFRFRLMLVDVETKGELTRGMTVCDHRAGNTDGAGMGQTNTYPNVAVAIDMVGDFESHVLEAVKVLSGR